MTVKYTVKACANLDDRVTTAKFECKEIEVDLYIGDSFGALKLVSEP